MRQFAGFGYTCRIRRIKGSNICSNHWSDRFIYCVSIWSYAYGLGYRCRIAEGEVGIPAELSVGSALQMWKRLTSIGILSSILVSITSMTINSPAIIVVYTLNAALSSCRRSGEVAFNKLRGHFQNDIF